MHRLSTALTKTTEVDRAWRRHVSWSERMRSTQRLPWRLAVPWERLRQRTPNSPCRRRRRPRTEAQQLRPRPSATRREGWWLARRSGGQDRVGGGPPRCGPRRRHHSRGARSTPRGGPRRLLASGGDGSWRRPPGHGPSPPSQGSALVRNQDVASLECTGAWRAWSAIALECGARAWAMRSIICLRAPRLRGTCRTDAPNGWMVRRPVPGVPAISPMRAVKRGP